MLHYPTYRIGWCNSKEIAANLPVISSPTIGDLRQLQKMIEKVKVPAFSDQVKGDLARSSGALVSLSRRKPWKAMSTTSTAELLRPLEL